MHSDLSAEWQYLALEFEAARDFRRAITRRLGLVSAMALALSASHLVPWIAGDTAVAVTLAIVALAVLGEIRARRRVIRAEGKAFLRDDATTGRSRVP